ncbi:hypothetical protein BCR36DRAFT_396949 [Piromyces finnis]|uniref:Uncharacterized protein n=1 Tax=Piromyces finnis TaxID=1754191 RepID=A0A1Y1VBW2_9FUNG|nr:hypothetical protein BCR36DRAFT_396949 [Piromyces finnis]|eukprot:ORX52150.1 hypothetical protein BCR36DRAFT_396949 [Piromyces finnis]
MNNQKILNGENKISPLVNKISTQQSPISPFKIINNNEQSPFTVEQTANCRLTEPQSPFKIETNNNKFIKRQDTKGTNLKITTFNQKSPINDHIVPISPFNIGSPNKNFPCPKTSQPLTSKGNQIFSAQVVDMPIIPQADTYNQSNRTSWVTTTSTINSASPAFYDVKRELNMSNINSMVSNVRKGQESNIIDKILFDTQYSGMVDQKYEKELVRHNCKNDTLYKCFSRSSSGIFSFKSPDTYPNTNSFYYIDVGNEIGTSILRMNKDKDSYIKTQENMYQNKSPNSNNSPMNDKESTFNVMKGSNTINPPVNYSSKSYSSSQANQNNNSKITSTFSYDAEYLLWRETVIDILKSNITESENYGNNRVDLYYKNINNENQVDYTLKMPIELLTLLNTKIK